MCWSGLGCARLVGMTDSNLYYSITSIMDDNGYTVLPSSTSTFILANKPHEDGMVQVSLRILEDGYLGDWQVVDAAGEVVRRAGDYIEGDEHMLDWLYTI